MIVALLFIFLLQHANASNNGNEGLNITWDSQLSMVKSNTQILLRRFFPKLFKVVSEANISSECEISLMAYSMAFMQWKTWAVRMTDASAKIPSGVLEGTTMEFGSYEECLNIRVKKPSGNFTPAKELFRGQYCTLSFHHSLLSSTYEEEMPEFLKDMVARTIGYIDRASFLFGVCIPSTCSADDIKHLSASITEPLGIKTSVLDCTIDKPFVWPPSSIAAMCILCILACLCIAGTVLDYLNRIEWKGLRIKKEEDKNLLWKILDSFSILTNFEFFLKSSSNNISCFYGIRVFTASWIIYGHNYFFRDTLRLQTYRRIIGLFEKFGGFSEGFLENFTFSVSTFFFLSGFLLVKTTWKQLEKNKGKLNILEFLLHKYCRLTPALVFAIIILYTLQVIDSGPLWNPVLNNYTKNCDMSWWIVMLYINNWLPLDKMCLEHTWFVSALMQLHIVGFILLFLTYRWKYSGILIGILLSVTCFTITSYIVIFWDVPLQVPSKIKDADKAEKYYTYIYVKPFIHLTAYLIGMIVAYFSGKYSDRKITSKYQVLGWILAVILAIFSIYAVYIPTESMAFSMFYHITHRTSWALSIGLLIYMCVSGCGGIVNKLLSSRPMQLLGQLSYMMYLTHYIVYIYKFASAKERTYFGNSEQVFSFISVFVICMFISFIGYVAVEVPFIKLEKLLFRRQGKKMISTNL